MTTITTQQCAFGGSNGNDVTLDTVTTFAIPANTISNDTQDYFDYYAEMKLSANADVKSIAVGFSALSFASYTFPGNGDVVIRGRVYAKSTASAALSIFEIIQDGQTPVVKRLDNITVDATVAHTWVLKMQNHTNPVAIGWLEVGVLSSVVG
jgi:hypothetical protein